MNIRKLIPKKLFPVYHYLLSLLGAIIYRFPSRKIKVVAVTGTKGKSTTVELVNAILEEAGKKTALAGTIRFKIGNDSKRNLYKMTMPGRFFLQKFLRDAVNTGCQYAVIEMSSEGAKQFRHKFISIDSLIFTNLSPEHIESHGSYEKYRKAKLSLAKAVKKTLIINKDDKEADKFLSIKGPKKLTYSIKEVEPYTSTDHSSIFTYHGISIRSSLPGEFNIYNMLGALTYAINEGISIEDVKSAFENYTGARGRMERVTLPKENPLSKKQNFQVIVDYAHTPDSLEKVYRVFKERETICILGNTGGGRDTWKRSEMAKIADRYCKKIILTNEDPYDEDPRKIIGEMKVAIKNHRPEIIMDRREAIATALRKTSKDSVVIITGKGTDPYIMEANGEKTPWDDAEVVREELEKVLR
ncbi:MAG: UDP-N-acetylmuramoyl-L-alanyl-D-glutamate--2,6-diaminopimelate ligase [Candidatus Pacebacteria bacterium]|nr:UDP-N-acetylmuramoyl-L-alanyl-D-glutamate--2,6-diaminopimelate ligase [Candidatus Paceibacterota bacterium]